MVATEVGEVSGSGYIVKVEPVDSNGLDVKCEGKRVKEDSQCFDPSCYRDGVIYRGREYHTEEHFCWNNSRLFVWDVLNLRC